MAPVYDVGTLNTYVKFGYNMFYESTIPFSSASAGTFTFGLAGNIYSTHSPSATIMKITFSGVSGSTVKSCGIAMKSDGSDVVCFSQTADGNVKSIDLGAPADVTTARETYICTLDWPGNAMIAYRNGAESDSTGIKDFPASAGSDAVITLGGAAQTADMELTTALIYNQARTATQVQALHADIFPCSPRLTHTGWTASADSFNLSPAQPPSLTLDGSASTYWRTSWNDGSTPGYPHYVQLYFGGVEYAVDGLSALPRQDRNESDIGDYSIYVSTDGATFPGTAAASGTWLSGTYQQFHYFSPGPALAIRLAASSAAGALASLAAACKSSRRQRQLLRLLYGMLCQLKRR